jgi:YD repeat-containing protein
LRNQIKKIELIGTPPMATFAYDLNGNRIRKTLENSTQSDYAYDVASRLTRITQY